MTPHAHPLLIGVTLGRMDEHARGAVARRAEAMAAVLRGLQQTPPDPAERLRMARHLAHVTPALGLRPEDITPADVGDEGISAHLREVMAVRAAVGAASAPRHLGSFENSEDNSEGEVRYIGPAD